MRRSRNWNPHLAAECESAWLLHSGSSVTANPLLVTFCLHVTPPPTIRSPRAGWRSFISICPALSRGLGPKQERSKAGGWMPTGRKWPQDAPHRSQPNQLSPSLIRIYRPSTQLPEACSSTSPPQGKGQQPHFWGRGRWASASMSSSFSDLPFFLFPHLVLVQIILPSPTPKTL